MTQIMITRTIKRSNFIELFLYGLGISLVAYFFIVSYFILIVPNDLIDELNNNIYMLILGGIVTTSVICSLLGSEEVTIKKEEIVEAEIDYTGPKKEKKK